MSKGVNMFSIRKKVVVAVAIIILAITAVAITLKVLEDGDKAYIICTSASPDGTHKIELIGNASPQFPFGPQSVTIILDGSRSKIQTLVANDGREANCNITWEGTVATVILSGKEQHEVKYVVTFEGDMIYIWFEKDVAKAS